MVSDGGHARDWRRCAAAGIVAACLAVGNAYAVGAKGQQPSVQTPQQAPLVNGASPAHRTQYKPLCEHPPTRDDAEYCADAKAAVAANESAQWAFWQLIVGALGVGAVVATLVYTARAANAARVAAQAIPILERPYVYSEMVGEDCYVHLLHTIEGNGDIFGATIKLKNYGKTPARLLHGEFEFMIRNQSLEVRKNTSWPIKYKHVLGEGEAGDEQTYWLPRALSVREAQSVIAGTDQLMLLGWFTYLDPWDVTQTGWIGWTYNPVLQRMTPDEHPQRHRRGHDDGSNASENPVDPDWATASSLRRALIRLGFRR